VGILLWERYQRRNPLMVRRWLILAGTVALAAAGCTSSPHAPVAAWPADHSLTADRDNRTQAELAVLSGATAITVRSTDLGGKLFRAWTPDGSRLVPHTQVDGDLVRLSFTDGDGRGPAEASVELASDVSWSVRLDGGSVEQDLDLRTTRVRAVDFTAGAQRIDLALPAPTGVVPVRMTGGASVFDLHLTPGAQAKVRFSGGAGEAVIDGTPTSGLAGGTVLSTSNLDTAADHYAVDAVAGVATLTIDHR
jgi:hypothetical protein